MKSAIEQLKMAEKDLGESCRKCCSMANNCCCYFVSKSFQNADNGKLFYDGVTVTYCPNAIKWCKTHMAQIPLYLALPSDVIFFDWNGNRVPDHIGLVRAHKNCDEIYTLEGNTNGGIVSYRTRPAKYVLGIYRPHFKASYDISKPIAEDGYYGYASIALTQKWLGVTVDGILGLGTLKALQKRLGVTADGIWGVGTSTALQKLIGVEADGYFGENSVKALQRYLNREMFKTTTTQPTTPTAKPQTPVTPSVPTTTPKADKYKVIDVSVWQGTINWEKVKADGVVGAIIRYADGKTLDSKFDYNMKQAKANGLHIGAYIFSRAKTKAEAEDEATRLYNACKPYAPDLPLYIDLEASTLSKYADTVAIAFLTKMKALGGRGGVYANLNWWNKYLTKTARDYSSNPFWIAQYYDKITHKNPNLFGMWQYSSSGKVSGINGKVDMDWLYNAYWESAPKDPTPTPTPTPTPSDDGTYKGKLPSLHVVKTAEQVIADAIKWGKWIAGYNLFHYGCGDDAHHNGCYFCGTQPKSKEKSGIKEWQYTYCCNPFIHACFAHGGQVVAMLSKCQKGSSYGFSKDEGYAKSALFKAMGKLAKDKLVAGDVLCSDHHVALYIGDGKVIQASGGDNNTKNSDSWNKSISVGTWNGYTRVYRFIGNVDSDIVIRIGEYSDRVKEIQQFLNWWNGKKVVDEDGIFFQATRDYVKAFQTAMGIEADGIVGKNTLAKMASAKKGATPTPQPVELPSWVQKANAWATKIANNNIFHYVVWKSKDAQTHKDPWTSGIADIYFGLTKDIQKNGSEGTAVRLIQQFLNWKQSAKLAVDGIFGNGTESALKTWQKKYGLTADGIWGAKSYAKALSQLLPYMGVNCIGMAYSIWHVGGGLKNKCSCGVISNEVGTAMLATKSTAKMLEMAKSRIGLNDLKIIYNNGKHIPTSMLEAGDIVLQYSGNTYVHTFYYMGNGKMCHAQGSNGKVPNDKQICIQSYPKSGCKIAIRYTGK